MPAVAHHLRDHTFADLFRDLGWDRATAGLVVPSADGDLHFRAVAQKRGLVVLHAVADRMALADRRGLVNVQRRLLATFAEHVAVVSSEVPRKQVWLWAVRTPDGRSSRHRAHPFFSAGPPAAFMDRLGRLTFTLDEEDEASLVEARRRVVAALDVAPEQNLFAKKPKYARRSDALARRLAAGDESAFQPFVRMHRGLARKLSKKIARWLRLDPDDAEQIACLGLMQAARKYDPARGFAFGTYAQHWIVQACQRFGPPAALLVNVPPYAFWPCLRMSWSLHRLDTTAATEDDYDRLLAAMNADPVVVERWPAFRRAWSPRRLPHPNLMIDPVPPPDDRLSRDDDTAAVRRALGRLHPRLADVIRRRYGLDRPEQTLEEIGIDFGLTRERVRQLQVLAEQKLRSWFGVIPPVADDDAPESDT